MLSCANRYNPAQLGSDIRVAVRLRRGARMRHRAEIRRADQLRVFPDRARIVVGLARLPGGAPCGEFGIRQHHIDAAVLGIDDDLVAIAQQTDRSADRSLRPDMADAEAARRTGEAAVGDQRDVLALVPGRRSALVVDSISRMPGPPFGPS